LKEKYQKMKVLLTRLRKELQDKNHQPKQSSIDLELADYEKTIQNLKEQLIIKDKDLQDLRDELSNTTDKYACLKLEIKSLEQQKIQTDERANKFKALLDIAKKELQHAKDLEIQRYQNEDHVRSLIETLQNQLDGNKTLINQLSNEKQQLTGNKPFEN
jgi:chromosome segregation ATPase